VESAFYGGVSGAMFGSLHGMDDFGGVIAHGVAGGTMSTAQGGDFGSGFASGAFSKAASLGNMFGNPGEGAAMRARNAIMAGIVGGTASVLGGGKFANGAVTGAMSRLLNDCAPGKKSPGYSFGIVGGGGGEAGVGTSGAAYQYSSGLGIFGFNNPDIDLSIGGFTSEGGMIPKSGPSDFVAGATGGLGSGFFLSNASKVDQLLGPFTTVNLNLPFVSAQYSFDPTSCVVIASISLGKSWGFSVSKYTTTTTTALGYPDK
jgi:hypothetical protein